MESASVVFRRKDDLSTTEFTVRKVEQVVHRINFPQIMDAAQICHTQAMSNAVVEWGASALKRVKTRLKSQLKNNMMVSLFHISLNGPNQDTEECKEMLVEATEVWRKAHFRNLPSLRRNQWLEDQRASNEEALRQPVERIGIRDIHLYLVGDSAYPISPELVKPYPEATHDPGKITFNKELSSARVGIKCTLVASKVVGKFYKSGWIPE